MSDRNRIIYNIQDVFFGHSAAEAHEVAGYQILKRINRIQRFDYDISTSREDVAVIGRSQNISRPAIEPPEVNIDFSCSNKKNQSSSSLLCNSEVIDVNITG